MLKTMIDITKLEKGELEDLLNNLQLLNSLKKSLWKRWVQEFRRIHNGVNILKVEYFDYGNDALSFVKETTKEIYKKVFLSEVDISQVEFIKNQSLQWWMRVFYNDTMCDIAYNRFQNLLK